MFLNLMTVTQNDKMSFNSLFYNKELYLRSDLINLNNCTNNLI